MNAAPRNTTSRNKLSLKRDAADAGAETAKLEERLHKVLAQAGYHDWIGCEYNPRAGTREGLGWLTQQ